MTITLPAHASAGRWETVDLGDGNKFEVLLTPPELPTYLDGTGRNGPAEIYKARFSCITGWRGVVQETENGDKVDVPFSGVALAALLRTHPAMQRFLLGVTSSLFAVPRESFETR